MVEKLVFRGDKYISVRPVDYIVTEDTQYKYRYSFSEVHVDGYEADGDIAPPGAKFEEVEPGLYYRYGNKVPVIVTKDDVYAMNTQHNNVGMRRQAFFALSVLESEGLVSGWRKK